MTEQQHTTPASVEKQAMTHFKVMRILQDHPDLTQRELADELGMSVGGLNYCLHALIDKGFVKMGNFQKSKNKFKYVYLLTPQGIAEKVALTSRFLKRKMEEYDTLKVEIEALKAEVSQDPGEDPQALKQTTEACCKSPSSSSAAARTPPCDR